MKHQYILFICFITLVSCSDLEKTDKLNTVDKKEKKCKTPIAVNYDFDNLRLHLNTSIRDTTYKIDWRWDYMNSDNGGPDSTGIDYFMMLEQPVFLYNDDQTLPTLSIKTDKNEIIEFSAITIFRLEDTTTFYMNDVFNKLKKYNLLKTQDVKDKLIQNHYYEKSTNEYLEELHFGFTDTKYGYSSLLYKIKTK